MLAWLVMVKFSEIHSEYKVVESTKIDTLIKRDVEPYKTIKIKETREITHVLPSIDDILGGENGKEDAAEEV